MKQFDRLRRIYNRFDPHRLPSAEEYVDLESVRGESVLGPLLRSLLFADSKQPFSRLFAGGRGAGKTTELRRFERELRDNGFYPIYIDVERTLDVNNCDFADFLIAIAYGVESSLREQNAPGYRAIEGYVKQKLDEIHRFFFTKIETKEAKVSAGAAELSFAFQEATSRRKLLDEEYEVLARDAVIATADLLRAVQKEITKQFSGLVLLVDGGDKIVPYRAGSDGTSQHTKIFAQRATQLCSLGCHVIYSVPLSFCYSPDAMNFATTSGAPAIVLPMTSLRGQNKEEYSAAHEGFKAFRELVAKRLPGEKMEEVFEKESLERVIFASGGCPTALMTLIQESVARGNALPISIEAANKAVRSMANSFARTIDSEYWNLLNSLKNPTSTPERSPLFTSALYYQFAYEYMNGSSWFEVNPVLRELPQLSA
ncbi:MAG: hypothetical protein ACOYON_08370 [Fimbriimonas sp.]